MEPTIQLSQSEKAELTKKIQQLAKAFPDPVVKKLLTKAAKPFQSDAKARAPRLTKDKHRYSTAKVIGSMRAPRGKGNIVATYAPGNLARSIRKIALRRLIRTILIGPKAAKRGNAKGKFSGNRVDGYYANMVEGGTKDSAPKPFMEPAWRANEATVLRNIEKELNLLIEKTAAS